MYIFYPTSFLILGPKKMITNPYQNLPHLIFDVNYEEKKNPIYTYIKHNEASQFHIINYHIHQMSVSTREPKGHIFAIKLSIVLLPKWRFISKH